MAPFGESTFDCFCGEQFARREDLIDHNVASHGWQQGESRRAVLKKYPE